MTDIAVDRLTPWSAPAPWQAVDFISDLHLHSAEPATFALWRAFMQRPMSEHADALIILGDFFEVWAGDDLLQSDEHAETRAFARTCIDLLKAHSAHRPVFFMHGNRDFLLGPSAMAAAGMSELQDPTLLVMHGQRSLLSHGDVLCLADTDYLAFRALVRSPGWQSQFLAKPLSERLAITRQLREQSEARKESSGHDPANWADVDAPAARHWLETAEATILIHGHTHRPHDHDLGHGLQRVVLSDWDGAATPPRGEVLRWDSQGLHRLAI
jgi:UDP-2,3-diacylglucosamine hydrolase